MYLKDKNSKKEKKTKQNYLMKAEWNLLQVLKWVEYGCISDDRSLFCHLLSLYRLYFFNSTLLTYFTIFWTEVAVWFVISVILF